MLKLASKDTVRRRIHRRIRKRVIWSSRLPRLNVFRSTRHIYAQVIDDASSHTLVSASSRDKEVRQTLKSGGNVAAAKVVGKVLAERAKAVADCNHQASQQKMAATSIRRKNFVRECLEERGFSGPP